MPANRPGRALSRNRGLSAGVVQLVYITLGVALAFAAPEIDAGFTVSGEETRALLIALGAGILPFIGIVYSLLFLVVQFGTTTFTPRLNIFRDSPIIYHAFGFFTAALVYCFTAAFTLSSEERVSGVIPIITVALVLAALAVFRNLQTTAFRSIQLSAALSQVANRGREVILGVYPDELEATSADEELRTDWHDEPPASTTEVMWPGRSQVLQVVDVPRLMKLADRDNVLIECRLDTGGTIPERGVVALIHGEATGELEREVLKSLKAGPERTFEQDPAFAFRVLADIALRALSTAVNDPTTATQALDTIDGLLRLLATRNLAVERVRNADGVARVVLSFPGWEDYVALALDEVIVFGLGSPQVRARLERLLMELMEVTREERRPPLERRLVKVSGA